MSGQGLGTQIYDGTSDLGLFGADITLIVCYVLGAMMIIVGFTTINWNDDDQWKNGQGRVTKVNCQELGKNGDNYKCSIEVSFLLNGNTFVNKIFTNSTELYMEDQIVDIRVKNNESGNVSIELNNGNKTQMGWVLVFSGIVVIGLGKLNKYIVRNYKAYAAAQGVRTMLGFL